MVKLPSIGYLAGLTGLAARFHQDWAGTEGGLREIVRRSLPDGPPGPPAATVLRYDIALAARLPGRDLEMLWSACVGGPFEFGPDRTVASGAALLAIMREECDRELPDPAPFSAPAVLVEAVLAEIAAMAPVFAGGRRLAGTAAALTAALARCAREVSADLALRFLLRIIVNNFLPVPPERYAALCRLGRQAAYDELIVDDLEFLVTGEPEG